MTHVVVQKISSGLAFRKINNNVSFVLCKTKRRISQEEIHHIYVVSYGLCPSSLAILLNAHLSCLRYFTSFDCRRLTTSVEGYLKCGHNTQVTSQIR